jgi:hypothetical protein
MRQSQKIKAHHVFQDNGSDVRGIGFPQKSYSDQTAEYVAPGFLMPNSAGLSVKAQANL